jgi:hypothetical protein
MTVNDLLQLHKVCCKARKEPFGHSSVSAIIVSGLKLSNAVNKRFRRDRLEKLVEAGLTTARLRKQGG